MSIFSSIRVPKGLLYVLGATTFFGMVGFVAEESSIRTCDNIYVHVDLAHDNYFIDQNDVVSLMTKNGSVRLVGERLQNINLKELEVRIKSHNFVEEAQVYKDHKGNLIAKVSQCRPIARIIQQDGPHAYINSNGDLLPSSDKYTARVMLVDGAFAKKMLNKGFLASKEGKPYLDLLERIDADQFWKAQISQLTIGGDGEIVLYPQVGDQKVEFGRPEEIEEKFKKLRIFYNKIMPFKGFGHYSKVSLKFKDQIVCE